MTLKHYSVKGQDISDLNYNIFRASDKMENTDLFNWRSVVSGKFSSFMQMYYAANF